MKRMNANVVNTHCPWSGDPVSQDSLITYRGVTVGFCNPGCRDKFERAVRHFDRAIAATADERPEATPAEATQVEPTGRTRSIKELDHEVLVRPFVHDDVEAVVDLMRQLAVFEGYIDEFRVTSESLIRNGFGESARFNVHVAQIDDGPLVGMAVTYPIHWTFTLAPRLVLKELFVVEAAREKGVGERLFQAVTEEARRLGADRIDWTVLATNERAKRFYRGLGARHDTSWENWGIRIRAPR